MLVGVSRHRSTGLRAQTRAVRVPGRARRGILAFRDPCRRTELVVTATRSAAPRSRATTARSSVPLRRGAPPVLVRQTRNGIVESVHRGDVVEVDAAGRIVRLLGDPDRVVTLRSCVKPFGLLALLEAGGVEAFGLTPPEIAIMASSHSGEDIHVRTIQGMYRRAGVSQTVLACGSEGMPLDALTAARLARDGEKAGPVRHMCSGQHSSMILLARLRGWPLEGYWQDDHPAQVAYRAAVATAFGTDPARLVTAIDGCGVATYAFPLRDVAQAYAALADPSAIPASDPRSALAGDLTIVRDSMLAHPEMVGGNRDRLDTSLMKAIPGRIVSKGGMEALRGLGILPGHRPGNGRIAGRRDRHGHQDRGRRRLRPGDVGGDDRGAPPGRGPRRWSAP